jgi:hypothetical protein
LDTNPNSYTYNNYFAGLGTYNLGTSPPPAGSSSADWTVVFGMYNCYGTCNKYYVERDLNPCSPTYLNYRQGGVAEANSTFCYIAGTNCCGQSTAANWVNNGAAFCSACLAYQPQIDNNPCSPTHNNTRNNPLGATAPCNYDANYSSAVGTLYVCNVPGGGVNSYTVYQNTNGCFTGNQFFANGNSYATNPSNSAPDTTQNWQQNGANYCGGKDLYQPQIQINPCAANYNGIRDELIEADSDTCAEVYIMTNCLDNSTAYSITYVKGTFAVNDRVTSSGVTFVITSLAGTNLAGPLALTSTGLTGCPEFTQFFDRCNGDTAYYVSATGLSGKYISSEVPGGCLEVQGVTASPTGTQISDYTSDPGCECV